MRRTRSTDAAGTTEGPGRASGGASPEPLVVGLVRGIHGLRGALRVEVLTDDADRFEPGSVLHREGDTRPLTVLTAGTDGPGLLVRFREITTREAAETLRDAYLVAPAPEPLPEGSYYWHDVLDSLVSTEDGEELGRVSDVFRAGGSEVYVVTGGRRGEILVPAVEAVVREFAPLEGRILVDRDGLALDDVEEDPAPRPRAPRRRGRGPASRRAAPAGDEGGVERGAASPSDGAGEAAAASVAEAPTAE